MSGGPPFTHDHAQYAEAVAYCAQVARAVQAARLETWNFGDAQRRLSRPDVDERLDLEAVTLLRLVTGCRRQLEIGQAVPPEGVVAIAEIGEGRAVESVDQTRENPVTGTAGKCDVRAAAAVRKPRTFGEVRPSHQGRD